MEIFMVKKISTIIRES